MKLAFSATQKGELPGAPRARQEAGSTIESGFRRDVPVPTSMEGRR